MGLRCVKWVGVFFLLSRSAAWGAAAVVVCTRNRHASGEETVVHGPFELGDAGRFAPESFTSIVRCRNQVVPHV